MTHMHIYDNMFEPFQAAIKKHLISSQDLMKAVITSRRLDIHNIKWFLISYVSDLFFHIRHNTLNISTGIYLCTFNSKLNTLINEFHHILHNETHIFTKTENFSECRIRLKFYFILIRTHNQN